MQAVRRALETDTQQGYHALVEDETASFAVDWRQEDDGIPALCEAVLRTGKLSAEVVDVDTDDGWIRYGERRERVPLTMSPADRHITLLTLSRVLAPDYEIRYLHALHGSDTGIFVPLPVREWGELERDFAGAMSRSFIRFQEKPNLFTDPVPAPRAVSAKATPLPSPSATRSKQ